MRALSVLKKSVLLWLLLIASIACSGEPAETLTATSIPPTATTPPTVTARPTATATIVPSTATPTVTPTPAPPSPSAIFDRVAPSIAYVETPLGSGSAILVEGNYLVTNAHVVWPYNQARVVFADGSEFEKTPLLSWDLTADLAVLGPLEELALSPLPLVDGEAEVVGSDVYLVGYPGEVDSFPQPTITRGLISRKREWEREGITFFQTDATISGGQSGGALLSEMGEVIGISGFAFDRAEFGLVASAADLAESIDQLIGEGDNREHSDPLIDYAAAQKEPAVALSHSYSAGVFLVSGNCGPTLTVEAESEHDLVLEFVELLTGEYDEIDETYTGVEQMSMPVVENEPYLVSVYQLDNEATNARLQSSCELIPLEKRDIQLPMEVGETVVGTLDYPGDEDIFYIDLGHGELVNFMVDSVAVDPFVTITYLGARSDGWVEDDDSGGGLFGTNADLTFRAPHSGRFLVIVGSAQWSAIGGYSLTASSNRASAPPPVSLPPTPPAISTDFGEMQHYESDRFPYTMLIPATWDDVTESMENCYRACFAGENGFLFIVEEDVAAQFGVEEGSVTREQYISAVLQNTTAAFPQASLQSRSAATTDSGLVAEFVHYRVGEVGGVIHLKSVVAFEDGIGFNALYLVEDAVFSELEPMIDYSFRTLSIDS